MADVADNKNSLLVGILILVAVVGACMCLCNSFRHANRAHKWANFHMPLLPHSSNLRLDAALRDAEEGFNVCVACGFENLKRNIFCTICGSTMEPPVDAGGKKRKTKVKDKLHHQRQRTSANLNRRRQARALKRKEWLRKADVEGKLYWYRDANISSSIQYPGYVLQFAGDPPPVEPAVVAAEPENEPTGEAADVVIAIDSTPTPNTAQSTGAVAETRSNDPPASDDVEGEPLIRRSANREDTGADDAVAASSPSGEDAELSPEERREAKQLELQLLTLEESSQHLQDEVASRPMTVIESVEADPIRPAINDTVEAYLRSEVKSIVSHSQLDFPTKIAEFVTRTSTALVSPEQSFLKLKIRRDELLSDSIEILAATPAKFSRCAIRLTFLGEQGLDAGGVYREWLVMIHEKIVSRRAGIFRRVDREDLMYHLNPMSRHDVGEHHLAHFFAAGRLLGRGLLEGNTTGFHLSLPLLKMIVGQPVTFSDLQYFDPETYKSLVWLLENDGADALGLDFTVTELTMRGESHTFELIPGGRNIDVNDENKFEYVDRKFKYLVFESVAAQLFAFLKGLYEVMPPEMLMAFDAEELDYILSGSDEIDVDDWERNSKYTSDLIEHPVREWFWELVREMPNEYRRRLLMFATGSSRVPLAGFMALTSYEGRLCPFTLKGVDLEEKDGYIRSHACFNRLDIPRYSNKHQLKTVLYAVIGTELYGFTTD